MLKKMRMSLVAATSMAAIATTPVNAQEATEIENAFSQCGIGAAIFQNNETAAIISNIIWDLGTTAFSSQTSSPSSCSGAKVSAAAFIHETYPVLEEEFVKGGGEHVSALLDMLQCGESSQMAVVNSVQGRLAESFQDEVFGSASRLEKSANMGAALDAAIASCNA